MMMMMMMMMMMVMMMNCFCSMVDQQKTFSLLSSRDHCQRSSSSQISNTPRAGFDPAQNLSSDLVLLKLCSSDNHYTTTPQFRYSACGPYININRSSKEYFVEHSLSILCLRIYYSLILKY